MPGFGATDVELTANRILAALPANELAALKPDLHLTRLALKQVLQEPGEMPVYVYFPTSGAISLLTVLGDGSALQAGMVGNEGMVDVGAFLAGVGCEMRVVVQVPGEALRMRFDVFRARLSECSTLRAALNRYTFHLLTIFGQSSACARAHQINERCARWFLATHDRVGGDRFPITHEILADMLGVRRASVTTAAGDLQAAGCISYRHGMVAILNRERMEALACECYDVIRQHQKRCQEGMGSR